ncbi:MAG TPA: NAD(P)-dependent oxidoreductase [Candidatus Binatia bacterium]|jgi:nucleoside-diphosphate-sugar epimerase|nr:NAD(P)-dependent oxidoreductase [Candidatus Binatia bacterium]
MKKIIVTGGSGRLGQFVIRDLLANGYQVLSLDRAPPREKLCTSWLADLRDSGDLFEAMRESYGVIHLGAYQAPNLAPDAETLSNNVSATYNVLRAAADLRVKQVVIASSTAAFGFIYANNLWAPEYLPLDEDHPSKPQDSYGLSKVLGEHIADSIVTVHKDMTVSSLRFPGVNFDLSYESFKERWRNPRSRTSGFWTYIDARDAAMTCRLALEAKFTGHEVFIASAAKNCMIQPTMELIKKYLPRGAKIKKVSGTHWSCVDSAKARRMLGFKPQHLWQDYLTEGQVNLG